LFGIWPLIMAALGVIEVIQSIIGRELRFGSPRVWGFLALRLVAGLALEVFQVTGNDLLRDQRVGIAELPEYIVVGIAGLVSGVLLIVLAKRDVRGRSRED
jgi:hypothetical protein